MVGITEISAMVAAAGVLVGAVYHILGIRHQNRMKHTDLIMRLHEAWISKELSDATLKVWNLEFKDYDDFVKKYGPWNSETEIYSAFRMVCLFFNEIGILLRMKLVSTKMVSAMFTLATTTTWEKAQPLVQGHRRQIGPLFYEDFEYLYNEMKKREQAGVKSG